MTSKAVRIAMWSGPRNISTAMMRSFGARRGCAVTDEPFYGAFLKTTGFQQPMADEVIASMDCDWQSIAKTIRGPVPGGKTAWYQKHMPHHMVAEVSIADFPDHRHAFLIRDPARVVASYAAKRVTVTVDDLGYHRQLDFVEQAAEMTGKIPVVMDSADILRNPKAHLKELCAALDIPWDPGMLQWEAGARITDGIWGSHWYGRVINTTGFGNRESGSPELDPSEQEVVDVCQPVYEKLSRYKVQF